jgi:hypothetical protein
MADIWAIWVSRVAQMVKYDERHLTKKKNRIDFGGLYRDSNLHFSASLIGTKTCGCGEEVINRSI